MTKIKYNINICDSSEKKSELMIHFTKVCPNHCSFCIDKMNLGVNSKKPNINKIINTIKRYKDNVSSLTISGGEPFIFIDDLKKLVDYIKDNTNLSITIITSTPDICYLEKDKFYHILDRCDNIQLSLQHYDEKIADEIRKSKSAINKQVIYKDILERYGNKVLGSINILKPYFETKEEILKAISYYNKLGFKQIKICEMFDADKLYIDIPKTLGIKMNSPFASGCKTEYDIKELLPDFDGKLFIKRSCFYRTKHQKANIYDLIKMLTRCIFAKKYFFGVIHENGEIAPYWI